MVDELTRRALLGAIAGGGAATGLIAPTDWYLERFTPFTGSAFRRGDWSYPDEVSSPHGSATVRFDDDGVPNVEGDSEAALYYAVGYIQAADRLLQMDLQRRVMRGRLSEILGTGENDQFLESDRFRVKMDFLGAAEATWESIEDDDISTLVTAYVKGVNAYMENEPLHMGFGLLGYEPAEWTPVDSMLMQKQISWQLTGRFRTLRRVKAADSLGEAAARDIFPTYVDHETPIIRGESGASTANREPRPQSRALDADFVDWLSQFETPPGTGSNSWVVSGEHTESGSPIVANDPHLSLMAPPVWYEMNLSTSELDVRGVMFPGVPFVVIGANDSGAWGFTNVPSNVMNFYEYETKDIGQYRYKGEWREFETASRTIPVADGKDRQIPIKKTVHGPYLERQGETVGVSWTGLTATETTKAIYHLSHAESIEDCRSAIQHMDEPTQNLVYANDDGETLYYTTGRLPIRRVDGEEVPGSRIFDGSTGEGEWEGFTPYGESSWDGFVSFDEKPHVVNPDYLATANQRLVDDPEHYIGEPYSDPYRGIRIYERLDERIEGEQPVTPEFMKDLQRDTLDVRARQIVPELVDAAEGNPDLQPYVDILTEWDYRMNRDSTGARVFDAFFEAYRNHLFEDALQEAGLTDTYYPLHWTVVHLDDDSRWFEETGKEETMVSALETAVQDLSPDDVYSDVNNTSAITHPLGSQSSTAFLNYETHPVDGSSETVNNFHYRTGFGSSWRMVVPMDGIGSCIIPGGNNGNYYSNHYQDQLERWANAEYKELYLEMRGSEEIRFEEDGS